MKRAGNSHLHDVWVVRLQLQALGKELARLGEVLLLYFQPGQSVKVGNMGGVSGQVQIARIPLCCAQKAKPSCVLRVQLKQGLEHLPTLYQQDDTCCLTV